MNKQVIRLFNIWESRVSPIGSWVDLGNNEGGRFTCECCAEVIGHLAERWWAKTDHTGEFMIFIPRPVGDDITREIQQVVHEVCEWRGRCGDAEIRCLIQTGLGAILCAAHYGWDILVYIRYGDPIMFGKTEAVKGEANDGEEGDCSAIAK